MTTQKPEDASKVMMTTLRWGASLGRRISIHDPTVGSIFWPGKKEPRWISLCRMKWCLTIKTDWRWKMNFTAWNINQMRDNLSMDNLNIDKYICGLFILMNILLFMFILFYII